MFISINAVLLSRLCYNGIAVLFVHSHYHRNIFLFIPLPLQLSTQYYEIHYSWPSLFQCGCSVVYHKIVYSTFAVQ